MKKKNPSACAVELVSNKCQQRLLMKKFCLRYDSGDDDSNQGKNGEYFRT